MHAPGPATWLTWLAWTDRFGAVWAFHVPGGALTGIAVALFAMLWSDRLGSYDEAHVEFAIPLSFTVAFALYFVLLLTKRGSIPFLVLLLAMIALSFWLACRHGGEGRPPAAASRPGPRTHRGLLSFGVLACVSWVQVAFFRVVATPEIMGDRIAHFLIPFTCACVLSLVMLALCLRLLRYLNISLAYRWSLPLFMLSYVPIFIDYGNPTLRLAAYAINFLGMFGVQFGCWLGACKYLRRTGSPALTVFGVYALGEGLGIFAGCLVGLYAVLTLDVKGLMVLSSVLLTAVAFAIMVTGFNPQWVFNRTRGRSERDAPGRPGRERRRARPGRPVRAGGPHAPGDLRPDEPRDGRGGAAVGGPQPSLYSRRAHRVHQHGELACAQHLLQMRRALPAGAHRPRPQGRRYSWR